MIPLTVHRQLALMLIVGVAFGWLVTVSWGPIAFVVVPVLIALWLAFEFGALIGETR